MERTAEVQLLHDHYDALGRALADALNYRDIQGGGWTHEADWNTYGSLTLSHPAGLGISISHLHAYRKNNAGRRLTIDGVYPRGYGGARVAPITVGMDQPVLWMVREIVRRLLPDYLKTLEGALKEARKAEECRQARIKMNRRLESVLPGLSPAGGPSCSQPDRSRSYWSGVRLTQGMAPALASGHVTLRRDAAAMELKLTDVPAELALTILGMLNPSRVVEGVIAARALEVEQAALLPADRVIRGELVGSSPATCPGGGRAGLTERTKSQ